MGAFAHIALPGEALVAGQAPALGQLAMHVQQPPRSCAFVQVIDVLRDQQQLAGPLRIEPRESLMGGVGSDRPKLCAARIVECMNQRRIAPVRIGRTDVFDLVPFP